MDISRLAYLHPRYFKPDPSCLNIIGEDENSKFVLLRFVAWEAVHDVTKTGFSLEDKIRLVKALEKYAHVFITSETPLPPELASYQIKISPEKIHHILKLCILIRRGFPDNDDRICTSRYSRYPV